MKRSLLLLVVALLMPVASHAAPVSAGEGTPRERAAGQTSTARAAAAEYQRGMTALRRGDYKQGLEDIRNSAMQGNARAESNLGGLYAAGTLVPQDYAKALKWYRLAAAQGNDVRAELNLGVMYTRGQGAPQDYVKAYKWLLLSKATLPATDRLYPAVTKGITALAAQMTPEQIAQAQQEASAWYATHRHTAH